MAHNGVIVGSPLFGAGRFGNGLAATNDSNYIALPSGSMPAGTTFTLEAWLKYVGNGAVQAAVSAGNDTALAACFIGANAAGNAACALVAGSGFGTYDSGVSIADGAWHHLAMVVTGGTALTLFVDGVSKVTATGSFGGLNPTSGVIGRWINPGNAYAGAIDEVAIWPTARYTADFTPPATPYTGAEGMSALYHLDADGTDSAQTNTVVDPSHAAILYSPFNWNVSAGYARTVNAGAYFRVLFTGTSVAISTDTTPNSAPFSQLWARVDNGPWVRLTLSAGNPSLPIATGLAANVRHLLEVRVKSTSEALARWTNPATIVQITGIVLDAGATVSAPARRSKSVLIYGDSITEGLRNINTSATPDGDDNLGAYSSAMLDGLDCEYGIVGFGATGILVSGQGGVPALPNSWNLLYAGVARSFTSPEPDLILLNEGENDGSTDIVGAYAAVVNTLLQAAPDAPIGLIVPFSQREAANIAAVAAAVGSSRVHVVPTAGMFDSSNSLDGQHPSASEAVGRLAPALRPGVAALLNPDGRRFSFA